MKMLLLLSAALLVSQPMALQAQAPRNGEEATALQALQLARSQTKKPMAKLVTMIGKNGSPQPRGWTFIFHDPASPTQLGYLEPGERPVAAEEAYKEGESPKFFDTSRVNLDSPEAFEAANKQAAAAKIGFDRISYELRGAEFTGEPIWTLRLLDADEHIVGIIHLSAETGKVQRTIWIRHTSRQGQRVIDSALTSGGPSAAAESASSAGDAEPKALPPVQNLEPPPPPEPNPNPQ